MGEIIERLAKIELGSPVHYFVKAFYYNEGNFTECDCFMTED